MWGEVYRARAEEIGPANRRHEVGVLRSSSHGVCRAVRVGRAGQRTDQKKVGADYTSLSARPNDAAISRRRCSGAAGERPPGNAVTEMRWEIVPSPAYEGRS